MGQQVSKLIAAAREIPSQTSPAQDYDMIEAQVFQSPIDNRKSTITNSY
jgi:hypothetical protein